MFNKIKDLTNKGAHKVNQSSFIDQDGNTDWFNGLVFTKNE